MNAVSGGASGECDSELVSLCGARRQRTTGPAKPDEYVTIPVNSVQLC